MPGPQDMSLQNVMVQNVKGLGLQALSVKGLRMLPWNEGHQSMKILEMKDQSLLLSKKELQSETLESMVLLNEKHGPPKARLCLAGGLVCWIDAIILP